MAAQVLQQADALPGTFHNYTGRDIVSQAQFEEESDGEDEDAEDGTDKDESEDDGTDEDDFDDDWDVREHLDNNLSLIERTGKFYAYFRPEPCAPNPGLEIEGIRRFGMPLQEHDIQYIIAASHRAPYGKGTETIVNEDVRRTWEIDGNRIKLRHPAWPDELNKMVATACDQLGVTGGTNVVEAQLYKLLVYEEGAMFKPHKDSEKAPRMFGTLVVCLPSLHTGGELKVSFNGESYSLPTAPYSEWASTCIAWYADVLHSVEPVKSGYRVVLTYNLVAKGWQPPPSLQSLQVHVNQVKHTLKRWKKISSPDFLVYNLEHNYTDASIRASDLKGTDVHRVQCLMHLQQELGLRLCLGSLEKSVSGSCEDSGWRGRRGGWYDESEEDEDEIHTIEDEHDRSLALLSVVDLDGNIVARNVGVDEDEHIVQIGHFEDREPDDEDYQGHTGNAGAQATHWYRDMALIIVPEENWISFVLNPAGYDNRIDFRPLLNSELSKLISDPTDERTRTACEKICQVVIEKHHVYEEDKLMAVFNGCIAVGRKDLAERVIRKFQHPNIKQLLQVAERCKAVRWNDLAASAIKSYRCHSAQDFIAIVGACKSIQREDLLEHFVLASPCSDEPTFAAVFNVCMDMKRVDLITGLAQRFQKSSKSRASRSYLERTLPTDFRKVVLPLVIAHSGEYAFQEWRGCLDIVFQGYDNIADCQLALKQLADGWRYHDIGDCSGMDMWKRGCWERALRKTSALTAQDAAIVKQTIAEQGNSWITDSLLPIAIKKNAEGNIAFALSLWRVLCPPSLPLPFLSQAYSTLAPSTISAISLSKPFKGMYASASSYDQHTPQQTTQYTASDLVAFGKGLSYQGFPEEFKYRYKSRVLSECKAIQSYQGGQVKAILQEITRQFGPGYSAWVVDMVQAYIIRVVGYEPEKPRNWAMPRRLGCGCPDCKLLDKFLLDPNQKMGRFSRAQSIRTHLQSRFLHGQGYSRKYDENFEFDTITRGSPHTLMIHKKHADFDEKYNIWNKTAGATKSFVRTLYSGSEQSLRTVLGPSYDDLVNLKIVTLRRLDGVQVSATYVSPIRWTFEDHSQVPDSSSAGSAVNFGPGHALHVPPTGSSIAGTKRKTLDDVAGESRPSKRPVDIIDLCDDP